MKQDKDVMIQDLQMKVEQFKRMYNDACKGRADAEKRVAELEEFLKDLPFFDDSPKVYINDDGNMVIPGGRLDFSALSKDAESKPDLGLVREYPVDVTIAPEPAMVKCPDCDALVTVPVVNQRVKCKCGVWNSWPGFEGPWVDASPEPVDPNDNLDWGFDPYV